MARPSRSSTPTASIWTSALRSTGSSFAVSLANGASRRGGLSEKQLAWVHILVVEHETPREERPATASLHQIRAMMDEAAESLKTPKITLRSERGEKIVLRRAGDASRVPGTIYITDGRGFDNNTYYGKLELDGCLRAGRDITPTVYAHLLSFDRDPAAVATAHGNLTGCCCFCNRSLTDGRSIAMGYGPICADKYGLPWGEERAERTVVIHAEEV
jgi:hypothetical protein